MAVSVQGGALEFTALIQEQQFVATINKIERQLQGLTTTAEREAAGIEKLVKNTTAAIAAYASIATAANFIGDIVRVRGEFQQLEVAFRTMLGNKQAADKLMAEAVRLAAVTPFTLQDVASGAKQLLAYGFAADTITGNLEKLGNIAAGVGAPLNDIVFLYGTLRAQGRAYTRDIQQFTARGIPIIDELAKQFGVSTTQVKDLVEAGKVGFPEVEKVINSMTATGGLFFNLMKEQSKTLTGQISNLQDAWSRMLNDIGQSNEGVFANALTAATNLVNNYQDVLDVLKVLLITYGSYKAAIIATNAVQLIATAATKGYTIAETLRYQAMLLSERAMKILNATMLSNPFVAVATGLAAIVAALIIFRKEAKESKSAAELLEESNKKAADSFNEQEAKIRTYLEVLKAGNVSENERLKIYNDLHAINPKLVADTDAKSLSYEALRKNVDAYLESLRKQLAIEANREAVTASIKQEQDISKRLDKARKDLVSTIQAINEVQQEGGLALGGLQGLRDAKQQLSIQVETLDAALKQQLAATKELGESGASLTEQTTVAQEAARRTVATINDQIKALKEQRDQVSTTSEEYQKFTKQIDALNQELENITGKRAGKDAAKEASDRVKDLQQLLEDISQAEAEARRSGLAKEESEIDRINGRYDALKKKAEEIKAEAGIFQRIENARDQQVSNELQKNAVDNFKKSILQQREVFNQFEEYKKEVGIEKARELVEGQTAEYDSFIDFLKTQIGLIASDKSLKGKLKTEFLAEQLTEAEKNKAKSNADEQLKLFTTLISATVTFRQRQAEINKHYDDLEKQLQQSTTLDQKEGRLEILRQGRQEELDDLNEQLNRQSSAYRKLNQDILFFSRERIKQQITDLESELQNNTTLSPALKKAIEEQIKALQQFLRETSKAGELSQKLARIIPIVQAIGNAFISISDAVRETNGELADTLASLGDIVNIASTAAQAFLQFQSGDVAGGISSVVNVVTGVIRLFSKGREERKRQQQELEEFQSRIFFGEQEITLLYRERAREQAKINDLKLQALATEKQTLEVQRQANAEQFENVLKEIQKLQGKEVGTINPFGINVQLIKDISLVGKSFDELEQLFLKGQLEGKAKELFEILRNIKQEGVDIDALLLQNAAEAKEIFTGTTADTITDTIVDGFRNGLRSASDFADNFEELMKGAMLNALKFQTIQPLIAKFFDQFAAASESDNVLTEDEINALRESWITNMQTIGAKFDELQKITNLSFTGGQGGGKSLQGGIKSITEETAGVLVGQFGGLRLTAAEQLRTMNLSMGVLGEIRDFTANLVEMRAILTRFEQKGIKLQ